METINIMMSLHTSAGLITIDKTLYVSVGIDDLEIERSLRSILKASQEYLFLEDAVTKKRCVIEPKNILFISYDAELLARKLNIIRNKQASKKEKAKNLSKTELEILFKDLSESGYGQVDLGQVTYTESIPGNLVVENPCTQAVISDMSPDWLINVDHTTKR